jgi:hypothetical protein
MSSAFPDYVLSKWGKQQLFLGGYLYRLHKINKAGSQRWRCINRECKGALQVGPTMPSGERELLQKTHHDVQVCQKILTIMLVWSKFGHTMTWSKVLPRLSRTDWENGCFQSTYSMIIKVILIWHSFKLSVCSQYSPTYSLHEGWGFSPELLSSLFKQ